MAIGYDGINNGSRNSVTGDKERPRKHVDAEYIIATYPWYRCGAGRYLWSCIGPCWQSRCVARTTIKPMQTSSFTDIHPYESTFENSQNIFVTFLKHTPNHNIHPWIHLDEDTTIEKSQNIHFCHFINHTTQDWGLCRSRAELLI